MRAPAPLTRTRGSPTRSVTVSSPGRPRSSPWCRVRTASSGTRPSSRAYAPNAAAAAPVRRPPPPRRPRGPAGPARALARGGGGGGARGARAEPRGIPPDRGGRGAGRGPPAAPAEGEGVGEGEGGGRPPPHQLDR